MPFLSQDKKKTKGSPLKNKTSNYKPSLRTGLLTLEDLRKPGDRDESLVGSTTARGVKKNEIKLSESQVH